MKSIRIATRESQLALWQANFVADRLREAHPELAVELVGMTTQGDRWLDAPLSEVGGKGLFIKELEAAMLADAADIAVHSVKDLPAELPAGFVLPVVAFRAEVEDVLISPHGDLDALPQGARVGSSSLRRQSQLLARRADLDVQPIRGNVNTRLAKLERGEFDAIVLAKAGLSRLQLDVSGVSELSPALCLPAPGQGALGIECPAESPVIELLEPLIDERIARCITAERGVSKGLGADCSLPLAALAELDDDENVHLRARFASPDGREILQAEASGADPEAVAADAVNALFAAGAQRLLDDLKAH